ncbi:MAG: hypothetical protein EZS28_039566, partial [Streblomastix strix]
MSKKGSGTQVPLP